MRTIAALLLPLMLSGACAWSLLPSPLRKVQTLSSSTTMSHDKLRLFYSNDDSRDSSIMAGVIDEDKAWEQILKNSQNAFAVIDEDKAWEQILNSQNAAFTTAQQLMNEGDEVVVSTTSYEEEPDLLGGLKKKPREQVLAAVQAAKSVIGEKEKEQALAAVNAAKKAVIEPMVQLEKGVPAPAIRGAALIAFSLSLLTGHDILSSGVVAAIAAYISITPGVAGDAMRNAGESVWYGIGKAQDNVNADAFLQMGETLQRVGGTVWNQASQTTAAVHEAANMVASFHSSSTTNVKATAATKVDTELEANGIFFAVPVVDDDTETELLTDNIPEWTGPTDEAEQTARELLETLMEVQQEAGGDDPVLLEEVRLVQEALSAQHARLEEAEARLATEVAPDTQELFLRNLLEYRMQLEARGRARRSELMEKKTDTQELFLRKLLEYRMQLEARERSRRSELMEKKTG